MKPTIQDKKFPKAIVWAALAALSSGGMLQAAPTPAPLVNPTGGAARSAAAAAATGEGLASLDDHALGAELSGRGLTTLLDHYFKANHVSDSEQQAIKTFGALRELSNPNSKVMLGEKIRRVKEVAQGIDTVLHSLKDPNEMMVTAAALVQYGVDPDINVIEYWGEDPVTQGSLKPVADAVVKLLDSAGALARTQADALANKLKGGNDPNADRWQKLDDMATMAAYSKQMSVYPAAAARPMKDPDRKKLAGEAITALAAFDNDQSGIQPRIRNMLGKLLMVSGEFEKAKATFATVIAGKEVVPPPNPYEQKEARYFTVVCDLLSANLASAKADQAALTAWQTSEMPKLLTAAKISPANIAADEKGNATSQLMLDWRIDVLEGDLAKTPAEKAKLNDSAEALLGKLREAHPELGEKIDQQLVKRMPANKVIDDKMAPSLLIALERKGLIEAAKAADEKADAVVMKKGIEAAAALIHRKIGPGINAAVLEEAQLAIAQLQLHLDDKVAAANAFLDYAQTYYPSNPTKATLAFDAAGSLVLNTMRKMLPNAPAGYAEVYARFLPIAINAPYNHKELAYQYGEQLRGLKNFKEAIRFLDMVPKGNAAYSLARYKVLLAWQGVLDTKQEPAERKAAITAALASADEVKSLSIPPKDDYDRNHAVDAIFFLADEYRLELKDPKRALAALDGVDKVIADITDPAAAGQKAAMSQNVIVTRINCDMALGDSNAAVQEVNKLLESAKGNEGIGFVQSLLAKLDKDYAAADLTHNIAVMKETARNAASITGHLVTYSDPKTQKDAKISSYYYAYVAYDARAQRMAGSLTDDPAERKKLLEAAAERFRFLETPEMHQLYIEQPDVKKLIAAGSVSAKDPDWLVRTGLALTDFDLGDYKDAYDSLGGIIGEKKLGGDTITSVDPVNGQTVTKPNDLYWEAYYKFLKSEFEVGKTNPQAKEYVVKRLKTLLLLGGIPERWQDEFESLRKEVIPDFNPDKPAAAKPAAAAAK